VTWEVLGPVWTVGNFAIVIRDTHQFISQPFVTPSPALSLLLDLNLLIVVVRSISVVSLLHVDEGVDPSRTSLAPLGSVLVVVAVGVYVVVFVVPLSISGSN
jgi:hypothetical protein